MEKNPSGVSIFGATTYRIESIIFDWILVEESRGGLIRNCVERKVNQMRFCPAKLPSKKN